MDSCPINSRLLPFCALFQLNTRLFLAALRGVDDDLARRRIGMRTNHIAFLALHLVEGRLFLARRLGVEPQTPYGQLDRGVDIDEICTFPPVEQLRSTWDEITATLEPRLMSLPDERLAAPSTMRFPIGDDSLLGAISCLLHHEAYHLGQIALLRKQFGLPSVRPE